MKRIVTSIIVGIVLLALVYFMGAVMAWDWNPGNWDAFGRGVLAFIGFFASGWVGSLMYFFWDDLLG